MVDRLNFSTEAFNTIKEDYEAAIYASPAYICNVYWKIE